MIYKFFPPNNYSLDNLRNSILYCRHYSDFNDPFEFWSRYLEGVPTKAERERLDAAFTVWGMGGHDPDEVEREFGWTEFFDSLSDIQPKFSSMLDTTRISCFSSDPQNLLMWSHYADGLRGFCIGYDEAVLEEQCGKAYFANVEYLEKPPVVDSFVYAVAADQYDYHMMEVEEINSIIERKIDKKFLPQEKPSYLQAADEALLTMNSIWRRAFAVKPVEWSYEKEIRLLISVNNQGLEPLKLKYPNASLKTAIIGERMAPAYRAKLNATLRNDFPNVAVKTAQRQSDRYKLKIE